MGRRGVERQGQKRENLKSNDKDISAKRYQYTYIIQSPKKQLSMTARAWLFICIIAWWISLDPINHFFTDEKVGALLSSLQDFWTQLLYCNVLKPKIQPPLSVSIS